jgi:hypothetical protein
VTGDNEEREDVDDSVVLVAQDTRCSPRRTGPAILEEVRTGFYWGLILQYVWKTHLAYP